MTTHENKYAYQSEREAKTVSTLSHNMPIVAKMQLGDLFKITIKENQYLYPCYPSEAWITDIIIVVMFLGFRTLDNRTHCDFLHEEKIITFPVLEFSKHKLEYLTE